MYLEIVRTGTEAAVTFVDIEACFVLKIYISLKIVSFQILKLISKWFGIYPFIHFGMEN